MIGSSTATGAIVEVTLGVENSTPAPCDFPQNFSSPFKLKRSFSKESEICRLIMSKYFTVINHRIPAPKIKIIKIKRQAAGLTDSLIRSNDEGCLSSSAKIQFNSSIDM